MSKCPLIIMTGATSGIGQIAAIEMAKRGARLVLTARNKERAKETEKLIKEASPETEVDFYFGDLSIMKDVRRMGLEIKQNYSKIDILIHNAGLHRFEQCVTSEGFSEMIAVNYLAPWLLTNTLKDSLVKAENAKIINVASEASRNHGDLKLPYDLTDISPFTVRGSSKIYGKTKLLNIMFTGELARQFSGTKVITNAINPGFNNTGLGRDLRLSTVLGKFLKLINVGNPKRGADIIIRLAFDPEYERVTGGYFNVGTGAKIDPIYPGKDVFKQQRLWNNTKELLLEYLT
ncbi:SDR family NAD(P)-dependent oxidoreductase [Bacillus atrophaeus]|uniref:SDR family NAD(P)-dependent oxidoreductase n=1 Tax=Bacillus atrophaeus TaxID=1452 RepID=UPI0007C49DDE|nr:SDR family NAD(P)-dependent oxidoreductase [Bacillus atrophaeus]MDS9998020.1 SDR family NAD(P)-dependent oxidoreductase [Bacillus atrophaeus]QUF66644.1 SDR family NAD(P)-dependent oxidoreductase [Bacillus atrophaeus]WFE15377.1 SDR family NAD(P)-dependent oxidoreductase [Bacillus atrophaeus]